MTQDSFAGAERIGATLDVLAEALLDERASHYPADSLRGFARTTHPSASALFGLRLSAGGHGLLTVRGLGTVVEGSTAARPADSGAGAAASAALLARYGGGAVRGAAAEDLSAERFQLPVPAESAEGGLRPEFPAALAELASGRDTLVPDELATGAGVEVRLVVPPVFHPLATRGESGARTEHLAEVAEELFAGGDAHSRKEWAVLAASLAEPFRSAGVVFAGVAALEVDGRPSHASLVVSLSSSRTPVAELATQLADTRAEAEVWTVLLPSGPAVVLVEGRTAPVPASLTQDGARHRAVSSVAQAFLPLPDGASVLTVQLGTVQSEDWELYTTAFAEILKSVQLGWDGVIASSAAPAPQVHVPAEQPYVEPYVEPRVEPQIPAQQAAAPAAPPAPPAPPVQPVATEPAQPKGTPVLVPPADFNPFAPPSAPVPAQAAPQEAPLKGTPVRVPPADFNPFAPPSAPAPAPAAAEEAAPGKGTAVRVPPADFNPFAAVSAPAAPAAPAPVAAPAPQPAVADPFGTVTNDLPSDPFGTVATPPAGTPTFAATPPPAAPVAAPPAPTEPPTVGKGTPVRIPPADFNPFAPPAAPDPAPAAAAEEAAPGKGTPVRIPPADFNPFAAVSAPAAPAAPAPAATPEPPANNPFG